MDGDTIFMGFGDISTAFMGSELASSLYAPMPSIGCCNCNCISPHHWHTLESSHAPACNVYTATPQECAGASATPEDMLNSIFRTTMPFDLYGEPPSSVKLTGGSTYSSPTAPMLVQEPFAAFAAITDATPSLKRWCSTPERSLQPPFPARCALHTADPVQDSNKIDECLTHLPMDSKKGRPRTAHRLVEQRYRNSLNGKIEILRCMLFPRSTTAVRVRRAGHGDIPHKTEVLRAAAAYIRAAGDRK
ncbi:hypothetical protein LTR17_018481 [Elasticomyces elasticus]|nr:hypothetical protein LTR17_018481 [Elasticomyces elasticus]